MFMQIRGAKVVVKIFGSAIDEARAVERPAVDAQLEAEQDVDVFHRRALLGQKRDDPRPQLRVQDTRVLGPQAWCLAELRLLREPKFDLVSVAVEKKVEPDQD